MQPILRIGARASPLSMAQTKSVQMLLAVELGAPRAAADALFPIQGITTSGDQITDRALIEAGGKGLFTKELDEQLLNGGVDCAVHSLKDLPTRLPDGVVVAAYVAREDPRDAFICKSAATLMDLPAGAVLGTASLRRQAQALHVRSDLRVVTLRGNVQTRLSKLAAGDVAATFLAVAGLKRLKLMEHATDILDPFAFPPAAGQGALAITARADDASALAILNRLEDETTALEAIAERAFLDALDGSCRTAIGAFARFDLAVGEGRFIGEALTPDGKSRWRKEALHLPADRFTLAGIVGELGRALRAEAGDALEAAWRPSS